MNVFKDKFERFKTILSAAHQSNAPDIESPSAQWRNGVMRSVREIGTPASQTGRPADFVQLTWRLAPVALLLMIILSLYIIETGTTISHQIIAMSVSEPASTYLAYIGF